MTEATLPEGAEGTVTINEDGSISFDPGAGYQNLGVGESQQVEITYTISDGQGGTSTATATVTVEGSNDGPVASDDSLSGTEDGTITFTAADLLGNDSDVDGDTLSISAFEQPEHGTIVDNNDGTFTFTPDENWNGETNFTYTVSDGAGGTDTATVSITVDGVNDGPVANDDTASATEDGGAVTINVLGNDTDLDGDTLTVTEATLPEGAEGTVTINEDGSISFDPGAGYQNLGVGESQQVEITYTISDGQGGTSTATATVTVEGSNDGPVASDDSLSGTEDGTITFTAADLLGNDSDVDGDTLSISAFEQPEHGTIVDNNDGTFTFTPDENWNGETNFTYTVSDGAGGTDTATVSITVDGVNDGPVANDDTASATEDGGAVTINVLGNDTDLDGDTLTVTEATLPEGAEGTVTINEDGSISFDPGAGYQNLGVGESQQVEITYTISDGQGGTSTATATVTVEGSNDGPVASDDSLSGTEDGTITFTAADLLGNDSDVDGDTLSISAFEQPEHGTIVDNNDGTFTFTPDENWNGETNFTYTVSDGAGGTDTATVSITVDGVNDGPVANDDTASATEDGGAVTINVLGNDTDLDGDTLTVTEATLPEGAEGTVTINEDGSISFDPGAGYQNLGVGESQQVEITYTISDGQGGTSTATATVTVEGSNDGPVASDDSLSGTEDGTITFTAADLLGNDSDVDGDTLSISAFEQPEHGTIVDNNDGTFTFTPDENWNGETNFTYTVSDGAGGTDTATVSITVDGVNDGPVANDDTASATEDGGAVTINVLGNDTDLDGDTLTVTEATLPEGAEGTVTINEDGSISFDPGAGYQNLGVGESQQVEITYTISDGQGGTSTATATVTVEGSNDGPVASDDSLSGTEDGTITFSAADLLGNDSDVDGDTLSISAFEQPEHGTIVDNNDGTFTFTPDENWNGETNFTYTVSDGEGGTDTATVSITVDGVNDGPVANDDTASATEDGGAVTINVLGNDTDLDGDTLTVTEATLPEGAEGTVTINEDGSISFDPGAGYQNLGVGESQQVEITYTISDGQGGTSTATATVTVEGSNDGPVASDDSLSGTEDGTITFTAADLLGNDSDVDGDTLSISAFEQPEHGTIVDNEDGTFTFTPDENWNGETNFTYTVSDGEGGTDTATVSITVDGVNDGPVANDDTASATEDGGAVTINVLGNDTDLDGDTLTVTEATLPEGAEGTVTINEDGSISFDPGAGYQNLGVGESQQVEITYTISDGQGGTSTATATVTVEGSNDGPVASDDSLSGTEDGTITFTAADLLGNDSDVDGDTLSISAFEQPEHGTIVDNEDGTFTFTPDENWNGETNFTYTVSDGAGGTDTATVSITVDGVNDGPVANDDTASATEDGGAVTINVLGNDTDLDGDTLTVTEATLPEGAEGTVTINEDGSISFDPGAGYQNLGVGESQQVEITYTISDGQGGTSTATATVTVEGSNDGPVASDDSLSGTEDGTITFSAADLLGNDSDVDGDTLSISAFEQPEHGTIVDNNDGTFTFTPDENWNGETNFTYTVSDGAGGTDTATVSITVDGVNDGPVANDDTASATEDGGAVTINVLGNDTDLDGDTLTVTEATLPEGAEGTVTINEDGSISFDPGAGYQNLGVGESQQVEITYTISDGQGGTSTATATVTVEGSNDGPVASDDSLSGTEDGTITFTAADLLGNDSDVDGDTLSISAFEQPEHGTIVDNNDGTFTFTPDENWNGETNFTYTVSDGAGGTDTATVSITVDGVNDGPVANDDTASATEDGGAVTINVLGNDTDLDGDTLTVTEATLPEGAEGTVTINEDGSISFDPGAGYQNLGVGESQQVEITYTISDGQGGTSTATATVTVEGSNDGPVASDDSLSGTEDGTITFTAADLLGNDSDVDGDTLSISAFEQPEHGTIVDNNDGTFTFTPDENWNGETNFTYTVSDGAGGTDTATVSITVDGVNDGPVANDDTASATEDGGAVTINVLGNDTDLDGDTLTVTEATLPEGAEGTVTINEDGSISFDPGAGYQNLGVGESQQVEITYTISDGQGGTSTATATVTVEGSNDGPVASDDSLSGTEDGTITFSAADLLGNDSDVDGDTLSISAFEQPEHGTIVDNNDGTFTFTPDENWNGETNFTYTVSDGEGGTDTATVSITVDGVNDGPVANDDTASATEDGGAVTINVLGNDTDLDGDTLTVTEATLPEGAEGTVTINEDGSISFDPGAGYQNLGVGESQQVEITYTISDGQGGTSTATATVTVEGSNDGPVASDDSLSGTEDGTITFSAADLLGNDSDVDGDTLSISAFEQPEHGTIVDNNDGTFTFTPDENWNGETNFTYTVSDGEGGTDTATVSITVDGVNDGPVANDDTASATEDGGAVTINVLGNDTDLDGDTLTVTEATLPEGAEGTVTINEDGSISFDPGAGYQNLGVGESQQVEITYTISDGQGGTSTATATVTVEGSNDGPVASDDSLSGTEDGTITFTAADLLGNDSDVDGDTLSISAFEQPEHGTIVDNEDGTFTFTPDENWNGETNFTYTVSDGEGGTDTATVSITVDGVNDGPVANDDTASATEDGGAVTINVLGNDTDLDGDTLTVTEATLPEGAEGTVTINEDGSISFDPGAGYQNLGVGESQQVEITYTISDGQGGTSTATATVTVEGSNDGPVASDDSLSGTEDGTITFSAADLLGNDSDVDGDTLSISAFEQPEHGTIVDNNDGTFTFTPDENWNGETNFTYTVSDGEGGTDTATVSITVDGVNDGPVANDDTASATEDGGAVTINVLGNDTDLDGDTLTVTEATLPEGAEGTVTINEDGSISFDPGAGYQNLGVGESQQVEITYTISDGQGGTSTATATVTVEGSNDGPVASDDSLSGTEDGTITFTAADLLGNDSDVDGDTLSISAFEQPEHGTIVDNNDGTFTFTPDENWNGETNFTYTVSDGEGGTDTATVSITVDGVNDGPVANDDTASATEDGGAVTINVLGNDTDLDGDTLTVTEATLPEGAEGTVTINEDGSISFDPGAGYQNLGVGESQQVEITYTISDGQGGTSTATATVTVEGSNDGPVASDDSLSGTEDGTITFTAADLLGNDSDVDGDTLSISAFEQPEHGTIVDNNDGTFTFTPDENWNGETNFTYTVSDGEGGTDTATVSITVDGVNDGPVANDDTASATEDGGAVTINVLGNDTDLDGDTLTVTEATLPEGAEGTVTINEDGSISFDPGAGYQNLGVGESQQVEITYTISDGQGGTSTATATVTVEGSNDGPVASDDSLSGTEDGTITFSAADLLGNDSDVDGDTLSISAFEQPEHGTIVDNNDGTFTFTPDENWNGETNFTYTVSDGEGGTDTATVSITVDGVNDGPVANDDTASATEDGGAVTINVLGNDTDLDGDTLTVTEATLPEGAEGTVTINEDGSISFDPGAGYQNLGVGESQQVEITYTISDGQGGTSTATATVTVEGSNDGPVASDDSLSGTEDGTITFTAADLLGNDSDVDGDTLSISAFEQPEHGTIVDNNDGTFTFTPDENWNGETNFTYTVSDGAGGTDTATVSITVDGVNDAARDHGE